MSFRHSLRRGARASHLGPLLIAATVAWVPPVALAQPAKHGPAAEGPSPEARAANKRALDLYKDGKYAEALEQFQKAYDLSPSWVILCNIGKMSRFTEDFARSLVAYRRCLKDGGADVESTQRAEVEQELAQLLALVGWAKVEGESGAEVRLDGAVVGTLPLDEKLAINPGPRTFAASKDGRRRERLVTVKAAESITMNLGFDEDPAHAGKKPAAVGFHFPQAAVVSAWVATSAFTAAAVATGTAAIVTSSNLKGTTYVGPAYAPAPDSPLAAESRRVDALAKSTNAFIGLAVVTGVAAISFSVVNAVASPKADKPTTGLVDLRVGPGSVVVSGTF